MSGRLSNYLPYSGHKKGAEELTRPNAMKADSSSSKNMTQTITPSRFRFKEHELEKPEYSILNP